MADAAGQALDAAVREGSGRLVAALAARFRDLDVAEDAFAFACAAAVVAWRRDGPPRDAAAWLYATARRRGFDLTRRARVRDAYRPDDPDPEATPEEIAMAALEPIPDERLRLIFTCCHPALAVEARIALTLRTICGLSVDRLARAFLTTELAMTQRLTRARRKIAQAGIPFEVPGPREWPERLGAVLAALEIAYAQAYEDAAGAGDAAGLAGETLRLSRVLCDLLPDEPEVMGLAASIRLAEARRPARIDGEGRMIPLDEQEVGRWDEALIDEAVALLARAAQVGRSGPYQVMAAIHGAHASRKETGVTPWLTILGLYDALMVVRPSPVAEINRAVALAKVEGAEAGLRALAAANAEGRVENFAPYHAARAHLAEQAGGIEVARGALVRCLELVATPAEQGYLRGRIARLGASTSSRTAPR